MPGELPELPDRYTFVRRIGGGGSAEVVLVEDLRGSPTQKAMKILRADVPQALVAGFGEEFRLLASLEHTGLARVHEFGELACGRAYYTVDFVEGRELGADGAPSVRGACGAMAQVCRALAYLHSRGYVHNDVTPANILVGATPDRARLLDFGLAGASNARVGSKTVGGTPGYIAPERLSGEGWDHRADLYSVGATLYRVLAGRRITDAERPTRALEELRHRRGLAELRPDLPEALVAVIEDCLAIDPRARPRHAFEVIERLGRAVGEVFPLETPGSARCYALASLLVGRDAELADLEQGVRDATRAFVRRLLLVVGREGSGKSRVLRELGTRSETNRMRVVRAVCTARTRAAEPLARLLSQLGVSEPATLEDFPRAIVTACAGIAQGTLLLLDEGHEAADAIWPIVQRTLELAREEKVPIAIALGTDLELASMTARQRIALLAAKGDVARVDLGPLARTHLRRILVSLFGEGVIPETMLGTIAERSGGNPLLLEEIVRELVDSRVIVSTGEGWTVSVDSSSALASSTRLEDFVRRRCARLSQEARITLGALFALGGRASLEGVEAIGAPDVALSASILREQGLVTATEGELVLSHDLAGRAALDSLDAESRHGLFQRAADYLVATNADDEAIARAYRGAGNAALAFDHALAAGIRARDHGEGRVALRALEEALAVADEAEVPTPRLVTALRALGDAYRPMGRPADALRMLDRAFALLPTSARGDRARTASRAVREASMANDLAAAELWLARAEDSLPEDDPVGVAAVANAGATFACYQGRLALARERFARAVSALEKAPESAENVTLRTTALLSSVAPAVSHSLELAQSLAEQARDLGEKTQNRYLLGVARSNLVHCLFTTGDMPKARAIAEDVLADAERAGNAFLMHLVSLNLAEVTHAMGDWDAARRHLTRARSLSEASGVWHEAAEGVSALCAWLEGDVRTAGKLATRALASAPVALAFQLIPLLLPAAAAAADRGDAGEAALIAERIDRHVEEPGRVDAAIEDAVRAYVLAAKDPLLGGRQLVSAIEGLEAVSFRAHMPMLLRDAAKLLARGGDRNAARACMRRAREALIARGCAAAVVRLDEIDLASGGAQERAGPRLSTVRSLDELARALRAVGRGAGFSEVRLFSLVDGVAKERGADGDPSLPTELEGAVRRVLAAGTPAQHGDLALHAVATDGLSACLAFSGSSRANALLLESAELGLATLAARASHKLDDSAPKTVRAKSSPEESRLLELTVGPLQIQGAFEGVVGKSRALMQALALLDRLADTDAPALLTGETGTGKEVFARALHAASQRAAGPFVTLNCAAIPATLFEAELFGYRKGAFTGAMRDQMGHARMADRGTLFLDEIGELPLELQPKLLRMVQERAVAPLGGGTEKKIDVRIVAATNRDLEQEVAKGRFRADLYYRLNVVEVHLPPLRERSGDVAELVRHLLARMDKRVEVTPRAMKRLVEYAWPGNVRELENELQRACVLASGRSIEERHLSPRLRSTKTAAKTTGKLADRVAAFERTAIEEVLEQCQGNRTRAAKVLGLTRQGLVLKLKKRGIGKSDNKRKGE